jgi:hypothetical protein
MRQCNIYPPPLNEFKILVNQIKHTRNGQFDVKTFIKIIHYYFDILKMKNPLLNYTSDFWFICCLKAFSQIDKDRDGLVERKELPLLLKKIKVKQIDEGVDVMLNHVKDNGSGKIKITDFLVMVIYYTNTDERFKGQSLFETNKKGCWGSKSKKYIEYV